MLQNYRFSGTFKTVTLTNNVNSLKYEKTAEAAEKDFKYVYRLTWYDKRDYQIAQVYITEEDGHQIVHDGYYYEVSNNENIDTSIIDLWLSTCLESQPTASGYWL